VKVKGTAFLGRKAMLVPEIGEDRWDALVARIAAKEPAFGGPILATSTLPMQPFLDLNDLIVEECYGGDDRSYFRIGELSAEWSLTEGPYKNLAASKSYERFAALARGIYANFFTDGGASSEIEDNRIRLRIQVPGYRHVYFEYALCGYFKRGLEIVSDGEVEMNAVRGFSKGDDDVLYEFRVD